MQGFLPAGKLCLVFLHHPKCLNGLVCTSSGGGNYGKDGINAVPEVSVMFQTAPGERCWLESVCEQKSLGAAGQNSRYLNNSRVGCLLESRSGIKSLPGPGAVTSRNGCSSSYKFIVPWRAVHRGPGKALLHRGVGCAPFFAARFAKCPSWHSQLEPRAGNGVWINPSVGLVAGRAERGEPNRQWRGCKDRLTRAMSLHEG